MTITIKAKSFEEARLAVQLHQSQESERVLASHVVNLMVQKTKLTAENEALRKRAEKAEAELRSIKALRYSSRRKRQGVDGVNA